MKTLFLVMFLVGCGVEVELPEDIGKFEDGSGSSEVGSEVKPPKEEVKEPKVSKPKFTPEKQVKPRKERKPKVDVKVTVEVEVSDSRSDGMALITNYDWNHRYVELDNEFVFTSHHCGMAAWANNYTVALEVGSAAECFGVGGCAARVILNGEKDGEVCQLVAGY